MAILKLAGLRIMEIPETAPATSVFRFEHSNNSVFAVINEDGEPAVFAQLDEARDAINSGSIEFTEADSEYYREQGERSPWHPVRD